MSKSWEAKSSNQDITHATTHQHTEPAAWETRRRWNRPQSIGRTSSQGAQLQVTHPRNASNSRREEKINELFKSQFLISSFPPSFPFSDSHQNSSGRKPPKERGSARLFQDTSLTSAPPSCASAGITLDESSQCCKLWSSYHSPVFNTKKKPVSNIIQVANLL